MTKTMKEETKILEANKIVKEYCRDNYKSPHYVYTDFVEEDRFIKEIKSEQNSGEIKINEFDAEELAEYAIEQIESASSKASLIGF